jgi:hypothetical protein
MPTQSYIISGTVKKSNQSPSPYSTIKFTNSLGTFKLVTSDKDGKYVFDLNSMDYSTGEIIDYVATDQFNNEIYSGEFTVTGDYKDLDINLSSRSSPIMPSANRHFQVANIGGNIVSDDNPFPVATQGLVSEKYDYVSASYPTTSSEVYTFRKGGSTGTKICDVTITYTDSTKETLSSAQRS